MGGVSRALLSAPLQRRGESRMAIVSWLGLIAVTALLAAQLAHVFRSARGMVLGVMGGAALGGGWWLLDRAAPPSAGPGDWATVHSVPSEACARCHADHHASWRQTFHRTMTRDASAETIR